MLLTFVRGWIVRLNGKGRIVIPGEVREKVGIKKGDNLILEIKGNEILLIPYDTKATGNMKKDDLQDFLSKH